MPASIFAGSKVKTLKDILSLNGGADVISSTTDPTSVAVDAAAGSLLLNTSSGKMYRKNDSGSSTNWTEVGSSAAFGINYISNPLAATNTTGWATYADAAGAQPVDGTGGSPSVTWTRSTTTPLRGAGDFNFVKDAANRQGQGVSTDFTIDNADIAKVLTVTFDYEVVSGTYAEGDLTVYLIADPAGTPVIIQPAGYKIQAATVGTKMKQIATFQTQATGTSYRLCFHVASTSASAYTLALDNISVGPQTVQYGAPVTDWVSFTPTGTWTNTTYTGRWRRVGDTMELQIRGALTGAPSGGNLYVDLPAGYNVDSSRLTAATNPVGTVYALDAGTANYVATAAWQSGNQVTVFSTAGSTFSPTVPFTWANTDYFSIEARLPITGWSSSVVMSNDTDTRVVSANYTGAPPTGTLTNAFNTTTFATLVKDTHGSYSSGTYTVPVSGDYNITANVEIAATYTASQRSGVAIFVNGNQRRTNLIFAGSSSTTSIVVSVSCMGLPLNAGDLVTIRSYTEGSTPSFSSSADRNYLSIARVSGPSTIAASETVAAKYQRATGQNIANNDGTTQIFDFSSKVFDTHNAVTTGASWKFTAPISGTYRVSVMTCGASGGGWAAGEEWSNQVFVNGVVQQRVGSNFSQATHSTLMPASGATTLKLNAGDYVDIRIFQNSGATLANQADDDLNHISIERIGN